jgi:hypothetical protein
MSLPALLWTASENARSAHALGREYSIMSEDAVLDSNDRSSEALAALGSIGLTSPSTGKYRAPQVIGLVVWRL